MRVVLLIAMLGVIFADVLSWHVVKPGDDLYLGDLSYSAICYQKTISTHSSTKKIDYHPKPGHQVSAVIIDNLNQRTNIEVQTRCDNAYHVDVKSTAIVAKFKITIYCKPKLRVTNPDACHALALETEENEEVDEELIENQSDANNEFNIIQEAMDVNEWNHRRQFQHPINGNNVLEDVEEENREESRGGYDGRHGQPHFPRTTQSPPTGSYVEDGGEELLEHPVNGNNPREVLEDVEEENWEESRGGYHGGRTRPHFPRTTQQPVTGSYVEDGREKLLEWRPDFEAFYGREAGDEVGNEVDDDMV